MATYLSLRRRARQQQNTLSYKNPDATQRLTAYRDEHYQASSDYIYGLENRDCETPALTLDDYLDLVHGFKIMAHSFELAEPDPETLLPTYEELQELVELIDEPQFEEEGL